MPQKVVVVKSRPSLSTGSAGLFSRASAACSVSALADASGGLRPGGLVAPAIN